MKPSLNDSPGTDNKHCPWLNLGSKSEKSLEEKRAALNSVFNKAKITNPLTSPVNFKIELDYLITDYLFSWRTQLGLEYTWISFPNFHWRPAPGDKCSDVLLSSTILTADKHDLQAQRFSFTRPGFPVSCNKEQTTDNQNSILLCVLVEDQSWSLKTT